MYSLLVCTELDDVLSEVWRVCGPLGWQVEPAPLDIATGERIVRREADAALIDVRVGYEDVDGLVQVFVKSVPLFPLVLLVNKAPSAEPVAGFRYYITFDHIDDLEHILISLSCTGMSVDQMSVEPVDRESGVPRVLIVDDDVRLASTMGQSLRSVEKFDVQVAHSGFQAGAILPTFQPDIAIVDISLGDIDGREVCAFIRNHDRLRNTKIIACPGTCR